ncbi:ferredoxin NADP+ oxidoreductase FNR [Besnoitia besnoiti]|uniref:ferredoxin--NADP(+) reductase n=1 Tax=Besnoitia besnoiti TaxID=94643 RepID=A0A2A9M234_BESBE|nr:ferredoxin NADP+ oxidoreductase FNR [Besnoitia besnoiti]PFH32558.1 ferredoxin NADP+ oxidoreductase FNR [Besnoitia besnoiti]
MTDALTPLRFLIPFILLATPAAVVKDVVGFLVGDLQAVGLQQRGSASWQVPGSAASFERGSASRFRPSSPLLCKVVSVSQVTHDSSTLGVSDAPHVFSVVLDHGQQLQFVEGQSIGIKPPAPPGAHVSQNEGNTTTGSEVSEGEHTPSAQYSSGSPVPGAPSVAKRYAHPRIYSIASSRHGDDGFGRTLTLCVKKHVYADPSTGRRDAQKDGICSTFLCNVKCGDMVEVTGPMGKALLLPSQAETPLVMLATGTGVAPFRGHLQALGRGQRNRDALGEGSEAACPKHPKVLLFIGARTAETVPYLEEWKGLEAQRGGDVEVHFALSRQMQNARGGRLYIQDVVWQEREKVWKALKLDGGHFYACGLKGMMTGIQEVLEEMAEEKGFSRDHLIKLLKQQRRWHVEVY